MARFVTGKTFGTTETVTAALLNQAVNDAAISTDSVDGSTIEVNSNALRIKDSGVTSAKIADDGVIASKIAAGALTDAVYPVGSIFTTVTNYADSAAVVNAIGGTTWTAFGAGQVLVGLDSSDTDFDTAEETGGAKTVTLDITQIPRHTHNYNNYVSFGASGSGGNARLSNQSSATSETGGGAAHTNVQPYIVVYMWKRTA